jgi:maltooligosyltrehalose trehalohydrolase
VHETTTVRRRLPIGAEIVPGVGVHFRVWAPDHRQVTLVLEGRGGHAAREVPLADAGAGYFEALVHEATAGALYRIRLGDDCRLYPDLASRFQPAGPHGPSEVIDPTAFDWTDGAWPGVSLAGQVIYEMHVGTFTVEGTWAAAARELAELEGTGVTVVEVMPVADFPGRFGWGYDGVDLYAPTRLYGRPDDFRRFVDEAHRRGLGVILDVVYNHFGPDGAFHGSYARGFFSNRENEWGEALNFDGPGSPAVREFFAANAGYWIDEFHLDGLRFDATHAIHDRSAEHILLEAGRRARSAAGRRGVILVAEDEEQDARVPRDPSEGGFGFDGVWNDDFHHSARVALTGCREGYYAGYQGSPQEFVSAAKHGYLYQGQTQASRGRTRGRPAWGVRPEAFVTFLENHDQVANSADGHRLHQLASPGRYRALMALALLGPGTPLLFQGQEFSSSRPFLFFADHEPALAEAVRRGRFAFLARFPSLASDAAQGRLADPASPATFERCRLDFSERVSHREVYQMTRDLLRLRRDDPVLRSAQRPGAIDGSVLSSRAFAVRFFGPRGHGEDRLLVVNLGCDLSPQAVPDPLLAPPTAAGWSVKWSSEDPRYGGGGVARVAVDEGIRIPGEAAVLLGPEP